MCTLILCGALGGGEKLTKDQRGWWVPPKDHIGSQEEGEGDHGILSMYYERVKEKHKL